MVQNVYRTAPAINANVKMMVILESIVKTVIIIFYLLLLLVLKYLSHIFIDDACWNDPCEGCMPLNNNSFGFKCTCISKSFDSYCTTG